MSVPTATHVSEAHIPRIAGGELITESWLLKVVREEKLVSRVKRPGV